MVDIHTHLIPNIDDGSDGDNTSIKMLKALEAEGVTDVFLTPHHNSVFHPTIEEISKKFDDFKRLAKISGCNANLFVGQEPLLDVDFNGKFDDSYMLTLGGSRYILLEFRYTHFTNIPETVYEFVLQGYIPIVVHVERYSYFTLDMAREIKGHGGLIQVGADSIVGSAVQYFGKMAKKLLGARLVDFVSSDYHYDRELCLLKAYKHVSKKYGVEFADKIFTDNGKRIVDEILVKE